MRRVLLILMVSVLVFCCGFYAGIKKPPRDVSFHDMIINHPHDLSTLITPKDKRIRALAAELQTPEQAYAYVRDRIGNDPAMPAIPAGDILAAGRASCLGKAVLLCSLCRALGMPKENIRVVTGEVESQEGIIDHAWVEMEHQGECYQLDASNLLGIFMFQQFRGTTFTRTFIRKEGYTFNDRHFAIVSRLNQMKGMAHPGSMVQN
jgi:hypothetical protein